MKTTILVDAGYLMTGAGHALAAGRHRPPREDILLHPAVAVDYLRGRAQVLHGMENSEVRWFDGRREDLPQSTEHEAVAALDGVELVTGPLRKRKGRWEQKRVDALIHRDLVAAARSGQHDIVLVAGDEDLAVAAIEARELGARVHVWGVEVPGEYSCSPHLSLECADHNLLKREELAIMVSLRARAGIHHVASAIAIP